MSHADPSARQLGFRHGSSLEVGTSPLIDVLPPADEALACQTPSGGRRGDATSRGAVSPPGVNGPDGIGNPGTGGSHSNMAEGGGADEDVLTKEVPHAEHELETLRALEVDATATVVEQTPLLRIPAGTPAHVTNKRHKSTASVTDIFHS